MMKKPMNILQNDEENMWIGQDFYRKADEQAAHICTLYLHIYSQFYKCKNDADRLCLIENYSPP